MKDHVKQKVDSYVKKILLGGLLLVSFLFAQSRVNKDSTSFNAKTNWCVAASGNTIHVIWAEVETNPAKDWSFQRIFYRRSSNCGTTWGQDVILTHATFKLCIPSIAVWGLNVHVVWDDNQLDGNDHINYMRSTDGGMTWEPSISITNSPFRWRASFASVAVWASTVHVVWHEWEYGGVSYIKYMRSNNGGINWEPEIIISSEDIVHNSRPVVVVSGANVRVAWHEQTIGSSAVTVKYKYSIDGGVTWSTPELDGNNTTGGSKCNLANNSELGRTFETNEDRLHVFPNPFVSYVRILGHEQEDFVLYDTSGRIVAIYRGKKVAEDVLPGVYFVKSLSKNSSPVRIVKVK